MTRCRLVHNGARVLVSDVAHESRDGGETSAWALAAPVVATAPGATPCTQKN